MIVGRAGGFEIVACRFEQVQKDIRAVDHPGSMWAGQRVRYCEMAHDRRPASLPETAVDLVDQVLVDLCGTTVGWRRS